MRLVGLDRGVGMVTVASAEPGAEAEGMTRENAEALVREVSAVPGFRGALHRLGVGPPDGEGWAVRVTAILQGRGGLVRSREAWARYRSQQREEAQRMVATGLREPDGVAPAPGPFVEAGTASLGSPTPATKREPAVAPLERWRRLTEEAIGEMEREAGRMLMQRDRAQERATQLKQDARRLRRALAVGAPPDAEDGGGGSIRARVLAWTRAHGGELVLSSCADELGLSIKRASAAASQLRADGQLERVGKGQYRLVAPLGPTAHAGEEARDDGG